VPDSTDEILALQLTLLADLLARGDSATARLLRLYTDVFNRLTAQWLDLLRDIEAKRDSGDQAGLDILFAQQARIRTLRLQTASQVTRFAREAESLVTADQRVAVSAGAIHAERLMESAVGVQGSLAKLPSGALRALVGRFSNGEPLRSLFDTIGPDAAGQAEQVLFRSVATGQGVEIAARGLKSALGVPLTRSMAISRTEMLGAYRTATLETYRANSDVVRAWRWNSHRGPGTCSACLALDGTIHPLTEHFFPGHVNCRCSAIPVTVGSELPTSTAADWFADQSHATQLRVLGPGKLALYESGEIDL
jgi:SPP1 gp7 family putative phage head morphogenesis protein